MSARWLHVPIEEVATYFPRIKFSKHCETPRHKHMQVPAKWFHAVIYTDHSDCWVSCDECDQLMLMTAQDPVAVNG